MASLGSGLLGLAFSTITSNYPANVPWSKNLTNVPSKSIMTTLFEQKQLPHKFTLAVSRGETNSSDGGTFTIGGLPDLRDPRVNATNDFASAALVATADFLTTTIAWYAITVEGLYYGTFGNMSINSTAGNYIVDSGSPAIVLPASDTERWMSMFDPPMPFNSKTLEVNCNATIPILEFRIGGKLFPMNPIDLVSRNSDGTCSSTVQAGSGPLYWLGDRFQRNVLAVYDWENEQMQ